MDQFNQQQQSQMNKGIPGKPHKNHGGHEMFDMHEVLSGTLTVLDQFMMLRQFCKDQELLNILDRQHQFITSQYNITAECFKTGSEPSQKTATKESLDQFEKDFKKKFEKNSAALDSIYPMPLLLVKSLLTHSALCRRHLSLGRGE